MAVTCCAYNKQIMMRIALVEQCAIDTLALITPVLYFHAHFDELFQDCPTQHLELRVIHARSDRISLVKDKTISVFWSHNDSTVLLG